MESLNRNLTKKRKKSHSFLLSPFPYFTREKSKRYVTEYQTVNIFNNESRLRERKKRSPLPPKSGHHSFLSPLSSFSIPFPQVSEKSKLGNFRIIPFVSVGLKRSYNK